MNTKKTLFIELLILVSLISPAIAQNNKIYHVFPLKQQPILDGEIENDQAWKTISSTKQFYILGSEELSPEQTYVKLAYSLDYLYFAIICMEPDIRKLKASAIHGETAFKDDSIEIFLQPDSLKKEKQYHHFCFNSAGSKWYQKRKICKNKSEKAITLKNIHEMSESKLKKAIKLGYISSRLLVETFWEEYDVSAKINKNAYSIKGRIPFAFLGFSQAPIEQIWSANFGRNDRTGSGCTNSTWSILKKNFKDFDNFAKIYFLKK